MTDIFAGKPYPRFEVVDDTARHALAGLTLQDNSRRTV